MGRPIHTRGLVLRRTDWSESSQIVTIDTRDHGIVELLAKGSRRSTRKSSSFAEPLDLAGWYDLVYRPRKGDLHLALEAHLIEGFPQIRRELAAWLEACFALDALRASFTAGDPHPELLRGCLSHLKLLGVGRGRLALRLRIMLELLHASGVISGWENCASCREPLRSAPSYWHRPAAILCGSCRSPGDRSIPAELRSALSEISRLPRGSVPSAQISREILVLGWERIHDALVEHLERAPRSLRYLRTEGGRETDGANRESFRGIGSQLGVSASLEQLS